ncbi:restriction endonuclease subunit S [Acinetobacter guillouiae]|uniref:restriction endonuclease subunit S n=1 Tax=Acinetobacter guillouiae TaxID=106649 RepID=UPI0021CFCCEB|nr:restriction endonuclease subunit S [Acinetobacter guillouiae]MCU4493414.1 restriction endonuclease subunit S [Acinetobacter guillouiae]
MEKQKCPELRFSQFKNDWNETTLGDVVDIVGGGTPDTNVPEFWNGDIDWYSPTEIGENVYANGSIKKITAAGLKNSSAKILPAKKTVLFSSRAGIGEMAILNKPAATNQGFQSFIANNIDVYFLYSMGAKIKKFALSKASGSTFLEISRNQLAQMEFLAPSIESKEQTQIGKFFQNLDQSIALHEKKLTQTQNLKKAMLEKMFPKAGSKQPEIRLKGFSGEWDISKIGDIFQVTSGSTPLRSDSRFFENAKINWVKTTDLNNGVLRETEEKVSDVALSETPLRILPKGTVFVAMYGGFNQIGRTGLLISDATCNQALSAIYPNDKVEPYYLLTYLNFKVDSWKDLAASSRKDPNITKSDVLSFPFMFPSVKEQFEISQLFKQLDETLALQQQQLQSLKNLKQAFLEKMFV